MNMNLYPFRYTDEGIEMTLTSDRGALAAGSVLLFSADVPPAPGCWVLVRGRLGEPVLRTWPQRRDRWLATATEVLSAPTSGEIQATKDRRLRAWGLARQQRAGDA